MPTNKFDPASFSVFPGDLEKKEEKNETKVEPNEQETLAASAASPGEEEEDKNEKPKTPRRISRLEVQKPKAVVKDDGLPAHLRKIHEKL